MLGNNPFNEGTTVSFPAALRVRVIDVEGDQVTLAQEFTDEHGNVVTLRTEIGLRVGDAMLLNNLTVKLSIEKESP